jgi:hypothetical protein
VTPRGLTYITYSPAHLTGFLGHIALSSVAVASDWWIATRLVGRRVSDARLDIRAVLTAKYSGVHIYSHILLRRRRRLVYFNAEWTESDVERKVVVAGC